MKARAEYHITHWYVNITLSRRNLTNLLHMLDNNIHQEPALMVRDDHGEDDVVVLVQPQEDDEHYEDREPGSMSWESDDVPS